MLDIQTMFFCEQVADVAIWFIREFSIEDILVMKHERVSDEIVTNVHEQFISTELMETEFVSHIYEQCVEGRARE